MNEDKKLKRVILLISVILLLTSLTQKCYCTTANCGDSIMVFLLGWFAVFKGGAGISWLANPLLLSSWLVLKTNLKLALVLSLLATMFSLFFLVFDSILANETGQYQQIISREAGYWLWLLSCASMFAGSLVLFVKQRSRNANIRGYYPH